MKIPQKPGNWIETFLDSENNKRILKLISDKKVLDLARRYNNEYVHWDKLRRKDLPKGLNPRDLWVIMKLLRSNGSLLLKFNGIKLIYSLLPRHYRTLHILDKESAGSLEIEENYISLRDRNRYIISSLMEEAIASSQLEGAVTTRKVAKEMLRQKRKPRNYSEQMILNGYKTLRMVRENKDRKLSKEFLLKIQKSITKDTLENKEYEGKFRDSNDIFVTDNLGLGEIYHIPPDYKEIPKLVKAICEFANSEREEFINPIVKAIILHFLIGYVHPFNDGNGRTARAILYWYVISRGYWLFEYMSTSRKIIRSRTKYSLAYLYTETDENDLTYFIDYNLKAIYEALEDMRIYIKRKQKEQREANFMVEKLREINFRQASILKEFMKSPDKLFTIKEIESTYSVVYQTARNDLLYLSSLDYITGKKIKNKFIFSFSDRNKDKIYSSIKKKL